MDSVDSLAIKVSRDTLVAAKAEQAKWVHTWRKLNENFYPFLYNNLVSQTPPSSKDPDKIANPNMLDGEPALALLVLSAGFMNGVTSPARKWVNIKAPGTKPYEEGGDEDSLTHSAIRTKILETLAGTNYYDTRAEQVYDGCGIGTSALLCYEDRDYICKFTVCSPGSYYLVADSSNQVVKFAREFRMKATDLMREFGEAALTKDIVEKAKKGGASGRTEYLVSHLIEENTQMDGLLRTNHPFRELYWFSASISGAPPYLAKRPLYEWPVAVFRWGCPDNSTYGVPPTMSVMGKAVQLQNLEYKSDQGLDKLLSPPMLADVSLRNRPKAFGANGITYTSNLGAGSGARPLYQVQMPFQELEIKRSRIVQAIKDGLFNYLFDMISQLDTVRSATEIDARREEKMVVLGPVLHRSYLEDIGVVVKRVYGILRRKGLLPELPAGVGAEIEFSNILSDVQKASDVATLERFTVFVGQLVPTWPEAQAKINILDVVKQYAEGLGVRPTVLQKDAKVAEATQPTNQMQELLQTSEVAKNFGQAAGSLGNVDVGGGLNAVQSLLGG
jgi:hypothetical protein